MTAAKKLDRLRELEADPVNFTPSNEAEFKAAMATPLWRISHLYKIMTKASGGDGQAVIIETFKPNAMQRSIIKRLWHRNLILKARQLGCTTLICILFLDYALFTPNFRGGIIAHTDDAAKALFRDKLKMAWDHLPKEIKAAMPLKRESADELLFDNNSSVRVSTSMRSGTLDALHVSEFGKICARFPHRAVEVVTGSIPAVKPDGLIFIESTAEGREGEFYKMSKRAESMFNAGKSLSTKDFRFHFFPWYEAPEYRIDHRGVVISQKDHDYFDELEGRLDIIIDIKQRAWYVETRDNDLSGNTELMNREYPSTPDEAFSVSTEGCYFAQQLAQARKERRILERLPQAPGTPCWTFWDIGNSDGTAIWVIQKVGPEFRCIRFYEAWGEPYSHAVQWLQSLGLTWDRMYLPHDADHVRQGQSINKSPKEMLEELMPGVSFEIVPRIEDVNWGIQQTRDVFPSLYFDEVECKEGIIHLENYRKKWSEQQQRWTETPDKSHGHSEAADALRQFGQVYASRQINISWSTPSRKGHRANSWRTI